MRSNPLLILDIPQPPPQAAGGRAVFAKYGSDYMSEIGKRGYQSTVNKYFQGDRQAANEYLHKLGRFTIDKDSSYGRIFEDPGPHPAHQGDES